MTEPEFAAWLAVTSRATLPTRWQPASGRKKIHSSYRGYLQHYARCARDMQLVRPSEARLDSYKQALARGWSPDNERGPAAASDQLDRIEADRKAFLAALDDREARGPPIQLPDGSTVQRLPGFQRWMWDGEFAGSIGLRWCPGTTQLPPYCLGHIGYGVVPWKQRLGYATRALRLMLPMARQEGLPFVEITTDIDNLASQSVIIANGGVLAEEFVKPPAFGSKPGFRYRIYLS